MNVNEVRNLIIIGSGPAGYTAAIYAARAGFSPLVIAGSITAGGALMNTTEVENFPGFVAGIQGPELMATLQAQAEKFGSEILFDDVEKADLSGDIKTVTTGMGNTYQAKSIIVATGSAYRELGIPEEKTYSGHGVSWCATCDGFFFKDQDVIVVGGGDSAMEEATFLTRFARSVTVVHRRDSLRASKIMAERALANDKISFQWNSEVVSLGGDGKLSEVVVRDVNTGAESTLSATGLFVAIGHIPRSELFTGQLDTDSEGYILVSGRTTATNLPGVFACGDVVDNRYRQAITAAGSGCAAALDAQHYLDSLTDNSESTLDSASFEKAGTTVNEIIDTPVVGTTENFKQEVLESEVPVLVDFWATWCGPCRAVAPILEDLAKEYAGKVKIVKVDTDENQELAMAYGVTSIPTLNFFKNGELVNSVVGAKPRPALARHIDEVLAD